MKKFYLFFSALALCSQVQAKSVSVSTAQRAGYYFLAGKISAEKVRSADDLQLVYTSKAGNATADACYYVFNAGNDGFIMVSGDDQVTPVIGYSTEGSFDANNIPENAVAWFDNYRTQIQYVIEHKLLNDEEEAAWKALLNGKSAAQKTTAVSPLLTTKWNQNPYYNNLCPVDAQTNDLSVTGCVATAMAQVMKKWNYPVTGVGSHTYTPSGIATPLTANFGATAYAWQDMTNTLSSSSSAAGLAIGTLMFHAGVAVEMHYSSQSSGSYVTYSKSPVQHCAEYGLLTYFNYDKGLYSLERETMTEAEWLKHLKIELDLGRPVIYAGYTANSEGHCWVADGYDANNKLHINWGWGGMANGYYLVSDMTPAVQGTGGGVGSFSVEQHAIVGITPPGSVAPDMYEPNGSIPMPHNLNLSVKGNSGSVSANATLHIKHDRDIYRVVMPNTSHKYKVEIRLHDKKNSANGNTYTVDAQFAYNKDYGGWSAQYDDVMPNTIEAYGSSTIDIMVNALNYIDDGTYFLEVKVTDKTLGVEDVTSEEKIVVSPNPASNNINIDFNGVNVNNVSITDMLGRTVRTQSVSNNASVSIHTDGLSNGMYFIRMDSDKGTITRQIEIAK